ncbi:MAG: thiazole synthase [Campylobacteraceae bacterium]|nr:thiazole synthase [Campylobacteraceae bacterium]
MRDKLILGGFEFTNRLFTGTGKFPDKNMIPKILKSSNSQMITVALRRVDIKAQEENILNYISSDIKLLPNTSGARNAQEAVLLARLAREAGCGDFIKIEVINDNKYLFPDNEETIKATKILADEGFIVLPYMMPDLISARKLVEAGAAAIMPLGSPIGSNLGMQTIDMIKILIENIDIPIIVDAGIGKPSQAAHAMEIGADAVLVNSAISNSGNPELMAEAFDLAVKAGRMAYLSKMAEENEHANASSPLTGFLNA